MAKSKYCYAILKKDNGEPLLEDGKFPIYWNKQIAKDRCKKFDGYVVHIVNIEKLVYFLITTTK